MTDDISIRDNRAESRFEAEVGDSLAFAAYRLDHGRLTLHHTVVPPQLEGRGIGSALIESALRSARERGLKVVPECSFVAAYMKRHPETQDLLASD